MPIAVAVTDAGGFTSEPWKVLRFPEGVNLSKRGLARAQKCRVTIVFDKVRHGIAERFKVSQCFLLALNGLFDDIRPPPVPLQLIHGSKSIWQFHLYHLRIEDNRRREACLWI